MASLVVESKNEPIATESKNKAKFLVNCDIELFKLISSSKDAYPNPETWYNNYGDHNPECSIDSKQCSKKMAVLPADAKKLCLWHYARMGDMA